MDEVWATLLPQEVRLLQIFAKAGQQLLGPWWASDETAGA